VPFQSFTKNIIALFSSIGVRYVPEVTIYELGHKTPRKAFEDFCMTFGEDDDVVNSFNLNRVIGRLQTMDKLRKDEPYDSRPIYDALASMNLEETDRLIDEMKKLSDDISYWKIHKTFDTIETATRIHHRAVQIH